tara:strand:+ start:603 stop:959 length:357 start_codon:yes stop_codon:yes gene_type:complete
MNEIIASIESDIYEAEQQISNASCAADNAYSSANEAETNAEYAADSLKDISLTLDKLKDAIKENDEDGSAALLRLGNAIVCSVAFNLQKQLTNYRFILSSYELFKMGIADMEKESANH